MTANNQPNSKTRLLVVDDEAGFTRLLRLNLERSGAFEVCEENNATAAMETARRFQPDAILLDVIMPGHNGYEIATEIDRDAALQGTPVIFLTALLDRERNQVDLFRDDAGNVFLSKPVDLDTLQRCLEDHLPELKRREAESAHASRPKARTAKRDPAETSIS